MSSLGEAVDDALAPGRIRAVHEGRSAEVEVVDVDRLGARVRHIEVAGAAPAGIERQADLLPEAARPLPDRVVPVEVAPGLGGAILRSRPDEVRDHEYFEVRTDGRRVEVERIQGGSGVREQVPFTVTREQLRKLVDGIAETFPEPQVDPEEQAESG